jgi:HPt (histidine-containing phosphotransfer) domain-containing protein
MKAYDRDKLVELFGKDPATIAAVEREFYDTARDVVREISESDDAGTIARSAHRLKGAAGMIGAEPLHDLSEAIERAAKAKDMPIVRRLHDRLRGEVLRVADQAGLPIEPL